MKKTATPLLWVLCGMLAGLTLAWSLYVSWFEKHEPPYVYEDTPLPQGSLFVSVYNYSHQQLGAIVLLDEKYLMSGLISGEPPFLYPNLFPFRHELPFPPEDGFSTVLSMENGKHEVSVCVGGAGLVAKQEFIQHVGITNRIQILIDDIKAGTNTFACRIIVSTNNLTMKGSPIRARGQ